MGRGAGQCLPRGCKVKNSPGLASVFERVREHRRRGVQFAPQPARPAGLELPRRSAAELGIYAPPAEFASVSGISITEVTAMIETGELTHIRLRVDGPLIHVERGLADLARLEHGPKNGPSQQC